MVKPPVSMVYISDHFASRRPSKTFSVKILLDNAMAQLSKKKNSKIVYDRRRITLSKDSSS